MAESSAMAGLAAAIAASMHVDIAASARTRRIIDFFIGCLLGFRCVVQWTASETIAMPDMLADPLSATVAPPVATAWPLERMTSGRLVNAQ